MLRSVPLAAAGRSDKQQLCCSPAVVSACESDTALWALEARKAAGRPFHDIALVAAGPQRLRAPPLFAGVRNVPKNIPLRVCIWGLLTSGPYGGGAHFLAALYRAFARQGHEVRAHATVTDCPRAQL